VVQGLFSGAWSLPALAAAVVGLIDWGPAIKDNPE